MCIRDSRQAGRGKGWLTRGGGCSGENHWERECQTFQEVAQHYQKEVAEPQVPFVPNPTPVRGLSFPYNKEMVRFGRREGTREARQGRQRAGTRTSALVPCSGCHPRSTLTGGGGATSTMLATRASSSESKEVLVWMQTVAKRTFELQYVGCRSNFKSVQYSIAVYSTWLGTTIQDRHFGRLSPY